MYKEGERIGGLTFLSISNPIVNGGIKRKAANFLCSCGTAFICRIDQVNTKNTTSCGCHRLKRLKEVMEITYKVGEKINGITYLGDDGFKGKTRKAKFECPFCKKTFSSAISGVKSGHAKSCGCFKVSKLKELYTTHKLCNTKEYRTWAHIKDRCYNRNSDAYPDYGARGIIVSKRWRDSFVDFLEDMGQAPSKKHSIERVNVNGNYCKSNCVWATTKQQNRNRRNTVYLTYNGITKPLVDWIEESGLNGKTVRERHRKGWQGEELFMKPIHLKAV